MRGHRPSAAVLVAVALIAVALGVSALGRGDRGRAVAGTDEAVTQAVGGQPALVPGTPRPGEQVALAAVLTGLALVGGATRWHRRRPLPGRAEWSAGRRGVRLRGPPLAVS